MRILIRRLSSFIEAVSYLNDLQVPPANRLEKLKGNLGAFHSIRTNDQCRIIFKWESGNSRDVEIVDYR